MTSNPDESPLTKLRERAIAMRESQPGYYGLTGPFRAIQEQMLSKLKIAARIVHNGDKGTALENILRGFLEENELLPARYGLSKASSHVLSTSGHESCQMDLVFYDALNSPRLLTVHGIQYFPIECCYGVIESKSNLSSKDKICKGLDNIASFKRLQPLSAGKPTPPLGFGILFGFSSDLKWTTLIDIVAEWESRHEPAEWPNLIVVPGRGILGHVGIADRTLKTLLLSADLREHRSLGLANLGAENDVLLGFYLRLLDLLNAIDLPAVRLHHYVMLPVAAGRHSVRFEHGGLAEEVGHCTQHGDFLRMVTEQTVEKIVMTCPASSATTMAAALKEAFGRDVMPAPAEVFVYNPDKLPLARILLRPAPMKEPSLAFYSIIIDERRYWLSWYYAERDFLSLRCPDCKQEVFSGLTVDDWWKSLEALVASPKGDGGAG